MPPGLWNAPIWACGSLFFAPTNASSAAGGGTGRIGGKPKMGMARNTPPRVVAFMAFSMHSGCSRRKTGLGTPGFDGVAQIPADIPAARRNGQVQPASAPRLARISPQAASAGARSGRAGNRWFCCPAPSIVRRWIIADGSPGCRRNGVIGNSWRCTHPVDAAGGGV